MSAPLSRVWIVRDPAPGIRSCMADRVHECSVLGLVRYIVGGAAMRMANGATLWEAERTQLYLDAESAHAEAVRRMQADNRAQVAS